MTIQLTQILVDCQEQLQLMKTALCAKEADNAVLRAELAALKDAAVYAYNSGYRAGHHYTVEGGYVDIRSSDMNTYHAEEVAELLAALVGEE